MKVHPDFILANKLKLLETKLKEWSSSSYGSIEKKKTDLLSCAANFDRLQELGGISDNELPSKASSTMELDDIAKRGNNMETQIWGVMIEGK